VNRRLGGRGQKKRRDGEDGYDGLKARGLGADVPFVGRASTTERIGENFDGVLAAAQEGAEWAVAILYRSLQPQVLRFLRARVPQDAEDIASQAWLEIARSLPRFSGGEDDFRGLVFTIARRRLADHRRATGRRPVDLVGPEVLTGITDGAAPDDEVLAGLAGDAAARRVAELLSPDQAEVVLLRVVAGLSVDEVAALLGKRPGTVRVLQHRALRHLAEKLGDDR
jgi:RNA polymerase sigma-70 factor, ECF subfamily